jgi:serine/threonine protein kinase
MMKDWSIVRQLGEGGFAKTFHAIHKHDGLDYCIKEIPLRGVSEQDLANVQDEAKILARLKHPNIVKYKTSFVENNNFYIVTELVTGGSLADLISKHPHGLPAAQTTAILKQLINAIQYMHSNGLIHRDIKSANILLKEDGTIKVCDFGLSKTTKADRITSTTRKGTVQYAPPEFFDEALSLTEKSDIWSIGITIYEMSTGHLPFTDTDLRKLLNKICESEPPFPNNSFANMLRQLLQKNPSDRPSLSSFSAKDMIFKTEKDEILMLKQTNQNLTSEIKDLQVKIASLQQTIDNLISENKKLSSDITALQITNTNQQQTINSLNSYNSRLNSEIKDLQVKKANLQRTNDTLNSEKNKVQSNKTPTQPPPMELFHHLRWQCNNQNPHDAQLVTVSASTVRHQSELPQNVLNYNTDNYFQSKNQPTQWLLFDLKGKSFQMKQIRIHIEYKNIARRWILQGSNNNLNWTTIHTQGEDSRCDVDHATVSYDINCEQSFTSFKFVQQSQSYFNNNFLALYSVEFIGDLR